MFKEYGNLQKMLELFLYLTLHVLRTHFLVKEYILYFLQVSIYGQRT